MIPLLLSLSFERKEKRQHKREQNTESHQYPVAVTRSSYTRSKQTTQQQGTKKLGMRTPDKWSRCRPIFREFSFPNAWHSAVTLITHACTRAWNGIEEAGSVWWAHNWKWETRDTGSERHEREIHKAEWRSGRVTGRMYIAQVYRGLFASPLPLNTGLLDAGTSCRNKCTAHKYAATICNQTVGSFSVSSKFLRPRLWNVYTRAYSTVALEPGNRRGPWNSACTCIYIYVRGYIRERRPFPSSSGIHAKLFGEINVSSLTDTLRVYASPF